MRGGPGCPTQKSELFTFPFLEKHLKSPHSRAIQPKLACLCTVRKEKTKHHLASKGQLGSANFFANKETFSKNCF